ncbi:MAG: 50S ribosomal protein L10 [Anaerolineae bacterium]
MAIPKSKKEQMVTEYAEQMARSQAIILADYRGLTVAQLTELRRRLREQNCGFQVIKNTLFKLALAQAGISAPTDQLQGPIAAGYCFGEVPPVAKTLFDFTKEAESLQIKGAILGNQFLDPAGAQALASLPPREVLLAQLLGALQGPMSNLAATITAPLRELVQVLKARSEQGQAMAA